MKKNVLVLIPVENKDKQLLEERAAKVNFIYTSQKDLTINQVKDANVILGNPPIEMIRESKKLEWLQLQSAGVGSYVKDDVLQQDVLLTNASGAYGLAISEYMLAVLLELYKKNHIYRDNQLKSNWSNEGSVKSIYNSIVLIVGLGDIGGEFAKKVKSLGAYTIGIRRKNTNKPDYLDELHFMDELEDLLPRADVVALSLPGTKLTYKIINKKRLDLMKNDGVLINVGRGNAIDTDDLCAALEREQILGAALDVTDPEPLPKEHKLWKMKNVIITPHVSGGFSLPETQERIIKICAKNIEAFFKGESLINLVDFSEGY